MYVVHVTLNILEKKKLKFEFVLFQKFWLSIVYKFKKKNVCNLLLYDIKIANRVYFFFFFITSTKNDIYIYVVNSEFGKTKKSVV